MADTPEQESLEVQASGRISSAHAPGAANPVAQRIPGEQDLALQSWRGIVSQARYRDRGPVSDAWPAGLRNYGKY